MSDKIDILKVFGAHVFAMIVSFSDVEGTLKIASLLLAIGYGVWKWRTDYVKHKSAKKKK